VLFMANISVRLEFKIKFVLGRQKTKFALPEQIRAGFLRELSKLYLLPITAALICSGSANLVQNKKVKIWPKSIFLLMVSD